MLNPSFGTKLAAFTLCTAIYALFTVAVFGSLLLPIYALMTPNAGLPVYVLTAMIVSYVGTVATLRTELKMHGKWQWFAKHAPNITFMRRYFEFEVAKVPLKLREAEKKEGAQFIIPIGPHGVDSMFRLLIEGVLDEAFPTMHQRIYTLAASVLFYLPLVRELTLWTGCVDARRSVAENVLRKGNSVLVIPGGEAEQIRTVYGEEALYLRDRKGFIRLSLRFGVPVVPAYCFGVVDTYKTSKFLFGPRHALMKTLGVCIPIATGLWGSAGCPMAAKHTVVFGEPLAWPCKVPGEPTREEIDRAHAEYMVAVEALFDKHKEAMGVGDRKLLLH